MPSPRIVTDDSSSPGLIRSRRAPLEASHSRALRIAVVSAAAALTVGALGVIGCHAPDPQPFDPRSFEVGERRAAREGTVYPMRPLPTTLQSTFLTEASAEGLPSGAGSTTPTTLIATAPTTAPTTGPALGIEPQIRLTLQDIIHRAVAHNLDIKVAGYTPAIDQTRVIEADARFDPTVFAGAQYQKSNQPIALLTAGSTNGVNRFDTYVLQSGVRQALESGGSIELRAQSTWTKYPSSVGTQVTPNPWYDNQLVLQITQPLLQNFGNDINRARIDIARNNQRISLLELRKQIEESVTDIEQRYWQLVQAERDVRIQEELLSRTVDTAIRLINRGGQDVTRVQVSQANSRVESRRAELIRLKARVKDLSSEIKRFMNDPQFPVASAMMVLPAAPPLMDPIRFDKKDLIDTAMLNRFELGEQLWRIENAGIAAKVGKNNLLPSLNVQGQVATDGLAAGMDTATDNMFEFQDISWQIGFQFEIPIGNRQARAIYQRALLQRQQAIDSYKNLIDQISLEIDEALREVHTTWDEMNQTRRSVFAAEDSLQALQEREDSGIEPITSAFIDTKLNQQQLLADAQRNEAEAISRYNIALARLEQAKGTLLKYNNIVMTEENLPFNKKLAIEQGK
jgi:outer membrane protein TolC